MERKMNQEIRNYRAAMFMGLSLRQCICSALAIGASVWIYMTFQNSLSQDVISWLCILGAAPFALMGFFYLAWDERRESPGGDSAGHSFAPGPALENRQLCTFGQPATAGSIHEGGT